MAIDDSRDLLDGESANLEVFDPLDPPRSRFLYVDVAAMRAKQLRKGALPRLTGDAHHPLKAERVAMEEVRRGLVSFDLPAFKPRAFTD